MTRAQWQADPRQSTGQSLAFNTRKSVSQYQLGLVVIPLDGRDHVGLGRALTRNLLIVLVIPALFTDADHRGLHDLASKTAVVRR